MTDLEHADISSRLALAIGWPEHRLYSDGNEVHVNVSDMPPIHLWNDFDYRDPAVIWPIAERFNCFPRKSTTSLGPLDKRWFTRIRNPAANYDQPFSWGDTAALAVALAVIKAKEQQ
jgi:hypothetical protein